MRIIQSKGEQEAAEMGWGSVSSLQFRSDGRELAAVFDVGWESRIAFWNLQRNIEGKPIKVGGVEGANLTVLSPDFGLISRVGYHEGDGGGFHTILSRRSRGKLVDRYLGWWWHECIMAMCFSPDGRRLAVTGWNSSTGNPGEGVALWDVAAVQRARASGAGEPRWVERQAAAKLLPADDFLMSLAFSPDGNTLAAGTANQGVFRWDVATGQQLPGLPVSEPVGAWVAGVAFSPDGKLLAARLGSPKPRIALFDTATGASWPVGDASYNSAHHLAFHPAGQLLATVAQDSTVTYWDTASGKEQQVLTSDLETLYCIAFSPDGRTAAAGGDNGQVAIWEVEG